MHVSAHRSSICNLWQVINQVPDSCRCIPSKLPSESELCKCNHFLYKPADALWDCCMHIHILVHTWMCWIAAVTVYMSTKYRILTRFRRIMHHVYNRKYPRSSTMRGGFFTGFALHIIYKEENLVYGRWHFVEFLVFFFGELIFYSAFQFHIKLVFDKAAKRYKRAIFYFYFCLYFIFFFFFYYT